MKVKGKLLQLNLYMLTKSQKNFFVKVNGPINMQHSVPISNIPCAKFFYNILYLMYFFNKMYVYLFENFLNKF